MTRRPITGSATAREADRLGEPRWTGQPGRLEVWYATFTGADGTGYWIHHELVAPARGVGAGPFGHGWIAVFPPGAPANLGLFRDDTVAAGTEDFWFRTATTRVGPGRMTGSAGEISWDLAYADESRPLYTFPAAAWNRELLPGAQVVPWPSARFTGTVTTAGNQVSVEGQGAVSRIYGHGNPARWCWLHAQLDPETIVEAVCAVANRRGLRGLPPATLLRLRRPGRADWPPSTLAGAARLRTRVGPAGFTIGGTAAGARLTAVVRLPPERCVTIPYADPDGSTATCTNTERADVELTLVSGTGPVQHWVLDGTGHAEIGTRP